MDDFLLQLMLVCDATLRLAAPLILAAMAGLFAERSGVIDLGLEGKMLVAAFVAATVSALLSDPMVASSVTISLFGSDVFQALLQHDPSIAKAIASIQSKLNMSNLGMDAASISASSIYWAKQCFHVIYDCGPWVGLILAIVVSMMFALLHAYGCVSKYGDQIVSGVAINIIIAGLTPTLALAIFNQGGQTPILGKNGRFTPIDLPGTETLQHIPMIGPFYSEVVSGHNIFVYMALILVPVSAWVLYRTRFGLRIRAVGENPSAVDTAGISVVRLRYQAMLISGALCGMAGAYLSTAHSSLFIRDMTAGKGFLALAAMVFGRWRPFLTLMACLIFAFADALQARLQGVIIPGIGEIPSQAIQAIPYVLTVVILAGWVTKTVAPKAIGKPYIKEFKRG